MSIDVSNTLSEGDKIELAYPVVYEKKMLDHKFTFQKLKSDEFRIVDHNFEP